MKFTPMLTSSSLFRLKSNTSNAAIELAETSQSVKRLCTHRHDLYATRSRWVQRERAAQDLNVSAFGPSKAEGLVKASDV